MKAQCMLRKQALQAEDIHNNWEAEVFSAHLLIVDSLQGEKNKLTNHSRTFLW